MDAAKAKKGGGDAFAQALAGAGAVAAASGLGNAKVSAFTQRLNNLFLRNAEAKVDEWVEANPGVPLTSSKRNALISQAIAETREGKDYEKAFGELTGKKPGEVGQGKVGTGPSQGTAPGPAARGVGRTAAAALPDSTVKGFAVRPVMDGNWIYGELQAVSKGKPVSADLYRMANRAGTTTNRYLLEQLRFYPQLDPNGEATKYLEQQIRTQRQGQTVSSANWQGVAGQMLGSILGERPAAAGTMPTPAGGGGFQYSGQAPVQAQPAARQVAPAAPVLPSAPRPMAIPQARVGSMPAPGNGTGLYNPLAPGSWLMSMIMPVQSPMAMPSGAPAGGDGGGWDDGPAVAASHADSGNGFTIPGARDANGRPPVFSRGGANAFAAMVRDSGGVVKASDIASSQRSSSKNAAVGGADGSEHLKGNAMDIHGKSEAWIRKNGAKYGWYVHDYDGTHGGHFEFRGGGTRPSAGSGGGTWRSSDSRGQSLIAMAQRNGWNPSDLAAIASFETGGTLNPSEPGRGAASGRIGLIQAGPNERRDYGLGTGDWNREMQGIEKYLLARGAKPGMGLADLYATVNGGNPRAGNTADGNGTVARSAQTLRQLETHRRQAMQRLGLSNGGSATSSPRAAN